MPQGTHGESRTLILILITQETRITEKSVKGQQLRGQGVKTDLILEGNERRGSSIRRR